MPFHYIAAIRVLLSRSTPPPPLRHSTPGCAGEHTQVQLDQHSPGKSPFKKICQNLRTSSRLDEATGSSLRFPGVARLILSSRRPLLKRRNRLRPARSLGPSSSSHPADGGFWPKAQKASFLARTRRRPDAMTTTGQSNAPDETGYEASNRSSRSKNQASYARKTGGASRCLIEPRELVRGFLGRFF